MLIADTINRKINGSRGIMTNPIKNFHSINYPSSLLTSSIAIKLI